LPSNIFCRDEFRKKILLLILLSLLVRSTIAGFLEFGNDEVYYWTYAQHLAWNYFDHPPMVALLIRLTTINLHFQYEFFVRLGPILCAAFNTWLVFLIGNKIETRKPGWYAALLYTSSFYCVLLREHLFYLTHLNCCSGFGVFPDDFNYW